MRGLKASRQLEALLLSAKQVWGPSTGHQSQQAASCVSRWTAAHCSHSLGTQPFRQPGSLSEGASLSRGFATGAEVIDTSVQVQDVRTECCVQV